MEVNNHLNYNVEKSVERIQEILDSNNSNYVDKGNILPSRDSLTYNNGYYVKVTALFIDVVGSSKLIDDCKRPTLAKIYRCFISECVAIITSNLQCREVSIHGDCVWGIFETPVNSNIDSVFSTAAKLNSLVRLLNLKLAKKNYQTISVGIGIDYGRTLMVKAGYKGSSINDVIWMGNVVNNACHLANYAGRNGRKTVIITSTIYSDLNEHNKSLLNLYYDFDQHCFNYEGNIVDSGMEDWIENNK